MLSRLPLILLTAALGCSGGGEPAAPEVAAGGPTESRGPGSEPSVDELGGPRDTLVLGFKNDADTLLSVVAQTATDGELLTMLNLQTLDSEFDCELKFKPLIAESFGFNEDQTVLSMTLRDDIRWSDGVPFTAKDIALAYELVSDPAVASPRLASVEHMAVDARPKVIDDHHIEFHFEQPYNRTTMLAHASLVQAVPAHLLADADRATLRGNPLVRDPVVNGPWKIQSWRPGESITLVPNENYSGPEEYRPRLKRIIYKIVPEYATRLIELENGDIDWMQELSVADADRLMAEHPEVKLHRRGWRFMDYVAWNSLDPADYKARVAEAGQELDWSTVKPHPLFGDPAVRRALTMAIDRDKIIGDVLTSEATGEAYGRPAVSTVTPTLCDAHNDDIAPLPYDPTAARAALAALGWEDSDGDGVLDKDGRSFSFTLATTAGVPRRSDAMVIIQSNLKQIGVEVKLETLEFNTFFERLRKKDYDASLAGWSAALFVDMTPLWHSGERYEFNFTSYSNEDVDALLDQALREPDGQKFNALLQQIQARVYEDQPYTFLYWRDDIVAVNDRFRDVKVDISSPLRDTHTWWVPADLVKYPR